MLLSRFHRRFDRHAWLPALYVGAGLLVLVSLRNVPGLASGALLLAAGLSTLLLRHLERRSQVREMLERHTSFVPAPSRLAATTGHLRAILPPSLGHQDLDRQHRGLAARAATLRVALFHDDDPTEVELLVQELIEAASKHVQGEIDALARLGVARDDKAIDADRLEIASAEYDFHLYCTGAMTLEALVDRVAGKLVATHLGSRHPALPSMDAALRQPREGRAAA